MRRALGTGILLLVAFFGGRWASKHFGSSREAKPDHSLPLEQGVKDEAMVPPPEVTSSLSPFKAALASGKIEDFLEKRSAPGWKVFRGERGQIQSLVGVKIPLAKLSAEEAFRLARELAPYFGADPSSLFPKKSSEMEVGARSSQAYHFQQRDGDFEVFGAELSMTAGRENSSVYVVNNSLQKIGPYNSGGLMSSGEAQQAVLNYYEARVPRIDKAPLKPFLYVNASGGTQLGWLFYVDVMQPARDRLQVLWGSSDAKNPLWESSVMSN